MTTLSSSVVVSIYHQLVTIPLITLLCSEFLSGSDELDEILDTAELAGFLELIYLDNLPGKGFMENGKVPKPFSLPIVNDRIFELITSTDKRCMTATSLTTAEFELVLIPFKR